MNHAHGSTLFVGCAILRHRIIFFPNQRIAINTPALELPMTATRRRASPRATWTNVGMKRGRRTHGRD
ncbi:hypothetical protein K435DRAFT_781058 [Dendrothele bispora CBS 962.96]|uniref:Uncharacterized protein n=1 Tax=Dendrothele bispora (strain CBS 962.96) TaxID=1314807 RepID=A0A4S8LP61_DENBC|nr:hypothetical protein K435DRAFT_781058 [Dendrothele bispora CBS 962.96]